MKVNATRTRNFVVVSKDADDKGSATEFGASKDKSCAELMAWGFCKTMQSEGFYNQRFFVIDVKAVTTTECLVDRQSGRSSSKPAEHITNVYT